MSRHQRHPVLNELLSEGRGSGLVAFVRTAESRSFVQAAKILGMTASGVAKAVARLEDRLGAKLFARTTRSISLTESGESLLGHAEAILERVSEAETALARAAGRPQGRLKMSLPMGLGRLVILPTLFRFATAYPEITLDVEFDSRMVDVVGGGYDVVLRNAASKDSGLRGRMLGKMRLVLCAAPAYLAKRGRPERAADLVHYACIRYRLPSNGRIQNWPLKPERLAQDVPISSIFNDPEAVLLAARAAVGIAALPLYAAEPALARGELVPLLESETLGGREIWLLWPPDRHHLPKVRAMVDHIVSEADGWNWIER